MGWAVTSAIAEEEDWDEEQINQRGETLVEWIADIWWHEILNSEEAAEDGAPEEAAAEDGAEDQKRQQRKMEHQKRQQRSRQKERVQLTKAESLFKIVITIYASVEFLKK